MTAQSAESRPLDHFQMKCLSARRFGIMPLSSSPRVHPGEASDGDHRQRKKCCRVHHVIWRFRNPRVAGGAAGAGSSRLGMCAHAARFQCEIAHTSQLFRELGSFVSPSELRRPRRYRRSFPGEAGRGSRSQGTGGGSRFHSATSPHGAVTSSGEALSGAGLTPSCTAGPIGGSASLTRLIFDTTVYSAWGHGNGSDRTA